MADARQNVHLNYGEAGRPFTLIPDFRNSVRINRTCNEPEG